MRFAITSQLWVTFGCVGFRHEKHASKRKIRPITAVAVCVVTFSLRCVLAFVLIQHRCVNQAKLILIFFILLYILLAKYILDNYILRFLRGLEISRNQNLQQVYFLREGRLVKLSSFTPALNFPKAIYSTIHQRRLTCTGIYCLTAPSADTPSALHCTSSIMLQTASSPHCALFLLPLFLLSPTLFLSVLPPHAESFLYLENSFALMFTSAVCFLSKCLKLSVHPDPSSSISVIMRLLRETFHIITVFYL